MDVEEVKKFHHDFLDEHEHDHKISGLVFYIVNDEGKTAFLHCFEAPTEVLMQYIKDLKAYKGAQPLLVNPRICSFTEEVPREYSLWGFRVVHMHSDQDDVPEDLAKAVFETLKNYLELGRELQAMEDDRAYDYVSTSESRQFLGRVPTVERINAYTKSTDLFSLEEYLELYDKPIDFTLESELVWPVEPFLKY